MYTDDERAFLAEHIWAVLATARADGTPHQAMVGYTLDERGRVLISTRRPSAKWRNVVRQPRVSLTVPDGRVYVAIYGTAETIDGDPERAELTTAVLAVVPTPMKIDPSNLVRWLDQDQRGILRITPEEVLFHE